MLGLLSVLSLVVNPGVFSEASGLFSSPVCGNQSQIFWINVGGCPTVRCDDVCSSQAAFLPHQLVFCRVTGNLCGLFLSETVSVLSLWFPGYQNVKYLLCVHVFKWFKEFNWRLFNEGRNVAFDNQKKKKIKHICIDFLTNIILSIIMTARPSSVQIILFFCWYSKR